LYAPITKREKDPDSGHLYVYGKLTGTDLDHDQQRMSADWLKTAVPDWFVRAGNIREGHDHRRAVGKAIELEEKADGWYIGAKIVDREAVEKVEEGVLNGFSIGVREHRLDYSKADAPGGTVVAGRICESSLVDSPCLPTATLSEHWRLPLAKADGAGELQPVEDATLIRVASPTYGLPAELFDRLAAPVKQALADLAAAGAEVSAEAEQNTSKADTARTPVVVNVTVSGSVMGEQALTDAVGEAAAARTAETYASLDKAYTAEQKRQALAAGQAMPNAKGDPSYVIKTKADLRRAIKAVGRGDADHDDVRKHILTRAKALGLESMVPENWNADGSLKDAAKADAATVEKAEALLRDVRALVPDLAKADGEDGDGADGGEDETSDIAGAQEAIAAIAKLIVSEAESLAMGNLNEACDIALLLDAVRALKWFQANERNEQSGTDDSVMTLAEDAGLLKADGKGNLAPPFKKKPKDGEGDEAEDTEDADGENSEDDGEKPAAKKKTATKADAPDGEPLLTKAEAADLVKSAVAQALAADAPQTPAADEPQSVTKTELAQMVKSAVAEARAADEERIAALTADLTKAQGDLDAIKALPVPGGPVLTRTAAQQESAMRSDSEALHAQANALLAKADAYSANRDLAEGYRQRAKALLTKAAA